MQNNIFPGLYVGQNLIKLDRVSSTNDYLKEQLSNFKPLDEGSAIMTIDQYSGKGQRGNTWQSQPGKNLTISIVFYPTFLAIEDQFLLNVCFSLGLTNWLQSTLRQSVKVKWPNDIMVDQQKICGILIENQVKKSSISSSIIGIGVNINQTNFGTELTQRVCSMKGMLGQEDDLSIDQLLPSLFQHLQMQYELLKKGAHSELLKAYNTTLMWQGELRPFLIDDVEVQGKIVEVRKDGLLHVDFGKAIRTFQMKEISHKL